MKSETSLIAYDAHGDFIVIPADLAALVVGGGALDLGGGGHDLANNGDTACTNVPCTSVNGVCPKQQICVQIVCI